MLVCSLKVRLSAEEAGQLASLGSPAGLSTRVPGSCFELWLVAVHPVTWGQGFLLQGVLTVPDIYINRPSNID